MPKKFKRKDSRKDKRKLVARKRVCRFCVDKEMPIDYKLYRQLGGFLTETYKIVPRRVTGNCAFHQKRVVEAIKRARQIALVPYTVSHS